MIPYNYTEFTDLLTSLVKKKVIPMSRIDDAVTRILRIKFIAGLFENPMSDESFVSYLGSKVSSRVCLRKNETLFCKTDWIFLLFFVFTN